MFYTENSNTEKIQSGRLERKFVIRRADFRQIEQMIRIGPGFFKEIYSRRTVNNLYFDDIFFAAYRDNIDGNSRRIKLRLRWYGAGEPAKAKLEYKIKEGLAGNKIICAFPADLVQKTAESSRFSAGFVRNLPLPELLREDLQGLQPVLLNRYERKYYLSANQKVRLTLDEKLSFGRPGPGASARLRPVSQLTVLELKYMPKDEHFACRITNAFPFRLGKISKYAVGIQSLYDSI